jgi:hypothetical protein
MVKKNRAVSSATLEIFVWTADDFFKADISGTVEKIEAEINTVFDKFDQVSSKLGFSFHVLTAVDLPSVVVCT